MSTMADLWPRWLHDADRVGDPGHAGPRRRRGAHARQVFTPETSGTYYISADGMEG